MQCSLSFAPDNGRTEQLSTIQQLSWSLNGTRLAAFGSGLVIWQWNQDQKEAYLDNVQEVMDSLNPEVLLCWNHDQLGMIAYHGELSPDGKFFAIAGWKSRKLRVWRIDSITQIFESQSELPKFSIQRRGRRHSASGFPSFGNSSDNSQLYETFGPAELEVGDSGIQHLEWKPFGMGRNALLTIDEDGTFRIWSKIAHSRRSGGRDWMKQVLRAPHVSGKRNISTAGFLFWKDYYCRMEEALMDPMWSMIVRDSLGFKLSRASHFIFRVMDACSQLWRVRGLDDLPNVGFARLEALQEDNNVLEQKKSSLSFLASKSMAIDVYHTNLPLEPELVREKAVRLRFPSLPPAVIDSVVCYRAQATFGLHYSCIQISDSCKVFQYQTPLCSTFGHIGNIECIQSSRWKPMNLSAMEASPGCWIVSTSYSPLEHWIWKATGDYFSNIRPIGRLYGFKACHIICSFTKNGRDSAEDLLIAVDTVPPRICLFWMSLGKSTMVTLPRNVYDILWNQNVVRILYSCYCIKEGRKTLTVWIWLNGCIYLWSILIADDDCHCSMVRILAQDCICALGKERPEDGCLYLYLVTNDELNIHRVNLNAVHEDWITICNYSLERECRVVDMTLNSRGNLLAILYTNNRHQTWIRLGEYPCEKWFPIHTSDSHTWIDNERTQFTNLRWLRDTEDCCWYLVWEIVFGNKRHSICYSYADSGIRKVKKCQQGRGFHELSISGERNCWLEYQNHQILVYTEENPIPSLNWLDPDRLLFWFCLFHDWNCLTFYLDSIIFSMANVSSTGGQIEKLWNAVFLTRLFFQYLRAARGGNQFEYNRSGLTDDTKKYIQKALDVFQNDDSWMSNNSRWKETLKGWLSSYWLVGSQQLPLDTMAFQFLMISKVWYMKYPKCSVLPLPIILLACISDCENLLFEILFYSEQGTNSNPTICGDGQYFDSLWHLYRYYGVGYWVNRRDDLIYIVDSCARASFQQRQNPMDTCLWYVLSGKTKALSLLFKVKGMKRYWEFFSSDFESSDVQLKAKKNAYVALSRHQIELASALFILANEKLEGLKLLLYRLHDISLFLVASRLLFDWGDSEFRWQILNLLKSSDTVKKEEMILVEAWMASQGLQPMPSVQHWDALVRPLLLLSRKQVADFLENTAKNGLESCWMTEWMLQHISFVYLKKSNRFNSERHPWISLLMEYGKQWFTCDPIFGLGCLYSVTTMTGITLETLLHGEERIEFLWYYFISCLVELTSEQLNEYKRICSDMWQELETDFHPLSHFPFGWLWNELERKDGEKLAKCTRLLSFLWLERKWLGLELCGSSAWKQDWWNKWLFSWNSVLRNLVKQWINSGISWRTSILSTRALFDTISETMESLDALRYFSSDVQLWRTTQSVYSYCRWLMDISSAMQETFQVETVLNLLSFNCPSVEFSRNVKPPKMPDKVKSPESLRRVASSHSFHPSGRGSTTHEELSCLPSIWYFKCCIQNDIKRQAILYVLEKAIWIYLWRQWRLIVMQRTSQREEALHVECKIQSIFEEFYRDWSQRRYPLAVSYDHSSNVGQDRLYSLWSLLYQKDSSCKRLLEEGWLVLEGMRKLDLEKATICNQNYGVLKQEGDVDRESYPHMFSAYGSVCLWKGDKHEPIRSLCISSDDPCWIAVATLTGLIDIPILDLTRQQSSPQSYFHRSSSASSFIWNESKPSEETSSSDRIWKYATQATCVTSDPVRQKYASGHVDGTIKLWNFGQVSCLGQWKVPNVGRISSLAFSSFGERLVACHATGQLVIWDEPFLAVGRSTVASPIIIEAFGKRRASQAIFLDDRNLIGVVGSPQGPIASGNSLRVYDIRSPHYNIRPEWTCKVNHGNESSCLLILEDRTKIVTGGLDGSISLVDIRMRHCVAELASVHRGEIQTLCVETNKARAIFSGSSRGDGKLWDSRTMKCLDTIQTVQHKSSLSLAEWNPWRTFSLAPSGILTSCLTDTCLLVGCADGSLRVWGKGWRESSKGQS